MDANVAAPHVRLCYFGCHRGRHGLGCMGRGFERPRRPAASQRRPGCFSRRNQAGGAARGRQSPQTRERRQEGQEPVGLHDGRPKQVALPSRVRAYSWRASR